MMNQTKIDVDYKLKDKLLTGLVLALLIWIIITPFECEQVSDEVIEASYYVNSLGNEVYYHYYNGHSQLLGNCECKVQVSKAEWKGR